MPSRIVRLSLLFLLVLAGTCLGPGASPVASGPIVQDVDDGGAVIVMLTADACRLEVSWSKDGEATPGGAVEEDESTTRHVVPIVGLQPATRYRYLVRSEDGRMRGRGSFRTAPTPGSGRVRFAAFGDTGQVPWWVHVSDQVGFGIASWLEDFLPGRGSQWAVARRVEAEAPDLIVHLGDVVYPDGQLHHYREGLFLPFERLLADVPMFPVLGNHDLMTQDGAPFFEVFEVPGEHGEAAGRYFDFQFGPVHFIAIDTFSTALAPGTPQWTWLETALARSQVPFQVVYAHRPLWTASRSRTDPENARLRRELHPMLDRLGVELVLSGHDHVYERFKMQGGVTYVVAGGGGKSLYEIVEHPELIRGESRYGFVLAEAEGDRMLLRSLGANGDEFERFELRSR